MMQSTFSDLDTLLFPVIPAANECHKQVTCITSCTSCYEKNLTTWQPDSVHTSEEYSHSYNGLTQIICYRALWACTWRWGAPIITHRFILFSAQLVWWVLCCQTTLVKNHLQGGREASLLMRHEHFSSHKVEFDMRRFDFTIIQLFSIVSLMFLCFI